MLVHVVWLHTFRISSDFQRLGIHYSMSIHVSNTQIVLIRKQKNSYSEKWNSGEVWCNFLPLFPSTIEYLENEPAIILVTLIIEFHVMLRESELNFMFSVVSRYFIFRENDENLSFELKHMKPKSAGGQFYGYIKDQLHSQSTDWR